MTTEKEKRKLGKLYDANNDAELLEERVKCKDLCYKFNQLLPSNECEQIEILKQIIAKTGKTFTITPPFWCDYGYNITLGENFYANHNCIILDGASVTFGNNVFVAPNCCFSTAGHPTDAERRNDGLEFAHPIRIGDNVWIGAGVIVLPGVTIGNNTVIGAGSVVNKDVPSNVIAMGNPCRIHRTITDDDRLRYVN